MTEFRLISWQGTLFYFINHNKTKTKCEPNQVDQFLKSETHSPSKETSFVWHFRTSPSNTYCCCSVAKSCLTLCDPIDCGTPGFPAYLLSTVSQSLLKFTSIESVMLSNHLILCHSLLLCLQAFPASWSFPMSRLFTSCSQRVCVCMYSLLLKYFGYLCISVHINLTFYWLHNIPLCEKTIVYLTN